MPITGSKNPPLTLIPPVLLNYERLEDGLVTYPDAAETTS
jgi:hypothetical protein